MNANPFPVPSPLEKMLLRELLLVADVCVQRGWCPGTAGNFSIRGRDELVWISPKGVSKANLRISSFVPVHSENGHPASLGTTSPSGERAAHIGAYCRDPSARAVVHAHTPALVRASAEPGLAKEGALVFSDVEMVKPLGASSYSETIQIPVLANYAPDDFANLIEDLPNLKLGPVPLVVLAGHGAYAWGSTPQQALDILEAAEFLCATRFDR